MESVLSDNTTKGFLKYVSIEWMSKGRIRQVLDKDGHLTNGDEDKKKAQFQAQFCSIFLINDLDARVECTISKCDEDTKLRDAVDSGGTRDLAERSELLQTRPQKALL